ncbi:MAG: polysaccharide pyruvyl transferase CsaB [Ruminococcaceae bacterium]|nr:polysaccharide pyruvyl transferase CsaB [Oscillospiraceae bacterium]
MEIKKILMVTMQMGIGGAETHILELSKALVARGYCVHVVSRGGSFVSELEEAGIRHFSFPLNTRKPSDILTSMRGLEKLIRAEKYDVVHAHARIPAAICGHLARKLGFRFVTTAHWVFTVTPLYRFLSDWGQKTLAVSEDIKQYLIDEYGVFPDNIRVTVNSLDTDKFSPDIDCSDIKKELGLDDDSFNIVCVSRMDRSRGEVPLLLARVASKLRAKYPKVNILLVGGSALGGEESVIPEIESICADDVENYGSCAVKLCGPRTDINKFAALADVFVGASRAALEAMGAECPVVLAGNEGYAGILDEAELKEAVATNFCCRGCDKADESKLLRDLSSLCEASREELDRLGKLMRGFVLENYGLDRMVNDAVAVYNSAIPIKKHGDVLISGYYGFGNTGDDSLLSALIAELNEKDPSLSFAVLAKNHRKAEKRFGVKCIERFNPFAVFFAMHRAKLFISGGGNLLQNGTSNKSLFYYLSTLKMAHFMGRKTMLYANGIGPLYGDKAKKSTASTVKKCDLITLREPDSAEMLRELLPERDDVILSADPAVLLPPATKERIDFILDKHGIPKDKRFVIVSLRAVMNTKEAVSDGDEADFEKQFASELSEICTARGLYPLFIPMQDTHDSAVCRRVCKLCGKGSFLSGLSVSELIALMPRAAFVCGMRLHSLIYALAAAVPFVALSYDPKVRAFAEYAEMPYVIDAPAGWEYGALTNAVNEIIEKGDVLSEKEKSKASEFRCLAKEDAARAVALIKAE